MMFAATSSAMIGSSRSNPLSATAATPTTTPTDVHTSVMRWRPSASTVSERYSLPVRMSARATSRFTTVATSEIARPIPTLSSGWGSSRRPTAATPIVTAAMRISPPSSPADR